MTSSAEGLAAVAAADAVLDVLRSGDPSAADQVLAPGAVLWHNDGTGEVSATEGFAAVAGLHARVAGLRVEVVAAAQLEDGAVIRYEVTGRVRDTGTGLTARNCIFVTVSDGLVTRIDEYVDPTFGRQLGF